MNCYSHTSEDVLRRPLEPGQIGSGSALSRLIQDAEIGSAATMTIIREGRELDLQIPIQ